MEEAVAQVQYGIQYTGDWDEILNWMVGHASSHPNILFSEHPPIVRDGDNRLRVTNSNGVSYAQINDYVYIDNEKGEFRVFTEEEIEILKGRFKQKKPTKVLKSWNLGGKKKRRRRRKK